MKSLTNSVGHSYIASFCCILVDLDNVVSAPDSEDGMTDHSVHPVTLLLVRFAAMPELLRYRCKLSYLQKAVEIA